MFVVRIDIPERESDYKAFEKLPDARARLEVAKRKVPQELRAAFLFEVVGEEDVRAAIEKVRAGQAALIARDEWPEIEKDIMRIAEEAFATMPRKPDAQGT